MKKEFWNSILTEKSWKLLQELKRNYKFVLIGGWAVYLLTKQKKSKDIDIVIDLKELEKFKQEGLNKNMHLKKYEIKKQEIDIDIYVEHFSKLAIPVEDIKRYTFKTQGFTIACPELLLILKQSAYKERENSIKGEKDKIDIVSILLFSEIDFSKYHKILEKYKIEYYFNNLKNLLTNFRDYGSVGLNPREFKIKKNKLLVKLKTNF
jgi:hypothetical protein